MRAVDIAIQNEDEGRRKGEEDEDEEEAISAPVPLSEVSPSWPSPRARASPRSPNRHTASKSWCCRRRNCEDFFDKNKNFPREETVFEDTRI